MLEIQDSGWASDLCTNKIAPSILVSQLKFDRFHSLEENFEPIPVFQYIVTFRCEHRPSNNMSHFSVRTKYALCEEEHAVLDI